MLGFAIGIFLKRRPFNIFLAACFIGAVFSGLMFDWQHFNPSEIIKVKGAWTSWIIMTFVYFIDAFIPAIFGVLSGCLARLYFCKSRNSA